VCGPHDTVRDYYTSALKRHGAAPLGVDWPSAASQYLRFVQLLQICDFSNDFSLNDFGCGYGALLRYFAYRRPGVAIRYYGVDISPDMIEAAQLLWKHNDLASFSVGSECSGVADYSLASGVFNVRLSWPVEQWESYIETILRDLRAKSRLGFSVNLMLPLDQASDSDQVLYRVQPQRWTEFIENRLECGVEQVPFYGLREFTLLARIHPS
jgi:SAM-dependent methyltransferase